jgi:site-specific DNA recombinase
LFDAVQAKLAASANARQLKLKASPSILAGRIFDERGNRMTPTHTNKQGARYRYYLSHAILQQRAAGARRVTRVSAPDVEGMVVRAIRNHLAEHKSDDPAPHATDREIIQQHLERVVIKQQAIDIYLVNKAKAAVDKTNHGTVPRLVNAEAAPAITIPCSLTGTVSAKLVMHSPSSRQAASAEERDALLTAIAKARVWVDDLVEGRASFAEIAKREGKVERHIRLLAPLAFVPPSIIVAIIVGDAPSPRITDFAKRVAYCWSRQTLLSRSIV